MRKKTFKPAKISFVGAGPGDPDLITIKGRRLLEEADVVIYAGSLVNKALLKCCKPKAKLLDSASMELNEITGRMIDSASAGLKVVRLQTGDPTFYGALIEQAEALKAAGMEFEIVPGVSSAFASAAALKASLTRPDVTQTIIFTRLGGRTAVPESEGLKNLAAHNATLCIFLSVADITTVVKELRAGGLAADTPAAVVYRASWPDEKILRGTLADLASKVKKARITKHAMILVGRSLDAALSGGAASKLYDKNFSHGFRSAR